MKQRATDTLLAFLLVGLVLLGVRVHAAQPDVFVPMVRGQASMAPRELVHPAGIACFEKEPPIAEDRTGRIFATCQANFGKGQVVWYIDGTEAQIAFTGGADYAGPGDLAIVDGQLVLSTVGKLGSNTTWIVPIQAWTP